MATIFRNAHLLDPMQGLEGRGDVLVENGKIVGVLQDDSAIGKIVPILVPQWDTQIIDLAGAFLSPGWMDIHTHVFNTIGDFCLSADDVGIRSGVTTIADAGTSSILTFDAFYQTAIATAKTRVFSFMNPSLLYIATSDLIAHQLEIVANPRNQDIDRAAAVVEAHRDVIVGFHVRPVRQRGETTSPMLETAKKLAELFSLPLLVHLGRFPQEEVVPSAELLPQLKAGDIVTHCFQPDDTLFDSDYKLLPVAKDAIDRGVLLDVSYSNADCSTETAKAAIAQGILPNILSTNLNGSNVKIADSLATVMTRFVNLGLSLSEVIERVTYQPAAALGKSSQLGGFKPGQLADFTVFEWEDKPTTLKDGSSTMTVPQLLKVKGVCRSGEYLHIERSPFESEPLS
ncbi:amidohydrolase family protein [Phormidium sp. CLA17]|uniref:amidohydrolase family protein n=1 Tax=Leptolyngbya sp. Cla-17 TaxID=2803751 RepID=UPI0014912ADE|nr:amidohydrolase family protein [Leptolyngbya sp. Cla-17]MBM0740667.1 amidohydrolase family protein [Leptolyngbya sp. Cla-17]